MTDQIDTSLHEAWETMEPPSGFADRVMQARRPPVRRSSRVVLVASAVVLVAAMLVFLIRPTASSGVLSARSRTSVDLGGRAVAVAEAGAVLNWRTSPNKATRVEQREGDVFYRVEHGGPFVVETPAGRVEVKGTCFRVEVLPMRQGWLGAAVGATAAMAAMVTVYEGKVLLANESGKVALVAGDRGQIEGGESPKILASAGDATETAPGELTRAELLARDAQQRQAIAALKEQLKAQGAGSTPESAPKDPRDTSFISPSKEELLQLAKECRLKWDSPSHDVISADKGAELGLSDSEREAMNRVASEFKEKALATERSLYIEATGDADAANKLSPRALDAEMEARAGTREEWQRVFWQLSQERAGLVAPPVDTSHASIPERLMRYATTQGDAYEKALGEVIGPDLAHSLREKNGGWGQKHVGSNGCPAQ